MLQSIRKAVKELNLDKGGIGPDLIGVHSLQAGGAMALKLHGASDTTIIGCWTSLTFLKYIHNQIAYISKDLSTKMGSHVKFFLYKLGREGVSSSLNALSTFFNIGKGIIRNYVRNCLKGLILSLKKEVVYWPSQAESDQMKSRLLATGFRHCVGIIDGTLICLDRRPGEHHECYYSRKSDYSINCTVVCDDLCCAIYFLEGWPGSAHDNRVFRNSSLFQKNQIFLV